MRFTAPTRRIQLKWMISLPPELCQIISQIDFRIEKGFGNVVVEDGLRWIEISINELQEQDFWWIPKRTLEKQLDRLVQRNILLRDFSPGRPNRWALAPESEPTSGLTSKVQSEPTNGLGSEPTNGLTSKIQSEPTNGLGSEPTNGLTFGHQWVDPQPTDGLTPILITPRARVLENKSKKDVVETSSPSAAAGSTFGENRIADLSFENNINKSTLDAAPTSPTPPLPPLAPGYPTDWAMFDAWVVLRFVHYGHAEERVCALSFAYQFAGHFERVADACDYIETGLRNMQVDGYDTKKVTRSLGNGKNIRHYLDQLANGVQPAAAPEERRHTQKDPNDNSLNWYEEEQRKREKEAEAYSKSPEGIAEYERALARLEADLKREERRKQGLAMLAAEAAAKKAAV